MVEIARALSMQSKLIVMDEPTSALSQAEVEKLFEIVLGLKAKGISIIFVTHRLEEVFRICDRFTVLRDGRNAGAGDVADDRSVDGIIRLMVGRELECAERAARGNRVRPGACSRSATSCGCARRPSPQAIELRNVSLQRPGAARSSASPA